MDGKDSQERTRGSGAMKRDEDERRESDEDERRMEGKRERVRRHMYSGVCET